MRKGTQVEVVCNLNQARSVITEQFIRRVFPSVQVNSSGVNAIRSENFPLQTTQFLREFDLSINKTGSENCFDCVSRIQSSDILIFSEIYMYESMQDYVNTLSSILILERSEYSDFFSSMDPVGMYYQAFKFEVAKNVSHSLMMLSSQLGWKSENKIVAVIPESEKSQLRALSYVDELRSDTNAFLMSLNYKSPEINDFFSSFPKKIELKKLLGANGKINREFLSKRVLKQMFEEYELKKILFSFSYHTLLFEISKFVPIVILTEPLNVLDYRNADAVISSTYADSIVIIS